MTLVSLLGRVLGSMISLNCEASSWVAGMVTDSSHLGLIHSNPILGASHPLASGTGRLMMLARLMYRLWKWGRMLSQHRGSGQGEA